MDSPRPAVVDSPPAAAAADESTLALLAKSSARGLAMLLLYLCVLSLAGWICFAFVASPLWHGFGGIPAARAGGFGAALALLVLLAYPQTWVTLGYLLGAPLFGLLLGKQAALRVAITRLARGRSAAVAAWFTARTLPALERVARTPGTHTVHALSRALLAQVQPDAGPSPYRWLLRKLIVALRIPELCSAGDFLGLVRDQRAQAEQQLTRTIEQRLLALMQGSPLRALWISLAVLITITGLHDVWIPWVRMAP